MLSQQSGLYVDTADQLVQLVRSTLVNAWYDVLYLGCEKPDFNFLVHSCSAPNFSLAPALDVLITGSYPRLPLCIRDRIIPLPPLDGEETQQAHTLLNCAIRRRLLRETIPERMKVVSIGQ